MLGLNRIHSYLPVELSMVVQQVIKADRHDRLNPVALESSILECLGILIETGRPGSYNPFGSAAHAERAAFGNGRSVVLTSDDARLLEQARAILTRSFDRPPTIESLCREVGMSPQKLKCGFSHMFKTTIGQYTANLRMTEAAFLLRSTDQDVGAIAQHVGYSDPSNFIKAFRRAYSCTPRAYRHREQQLH